MSLYTYLLLLSIFVNSSYCFVNFEDGFEYNFEFKSETINEVKKQELHEVLSMNLHIRKNSDGLICRITNIKTPKMMPITPQNIKQYEEPFKILLSEDKKFIGLATTDKRMDGPVFRRGAMQFLFDNPNNYARYLDDDFKVEDREITLSFGRCMAMIHRAVKGNDLIITAEARKDDCFIDSNNKDFVGRITDSSVTSEIITFDKKQKTIKKVEQVMNVQFIEGGSTNGMHRSTYLYLKSVESVSDTIKLAKKLVSRFIRIAFL